MANKNGSMTTSELATRTMAGKEKHRKTQKVVYMYELLYWRYGLPSVGDLLYDSINASSEVH